MGIYWATLTCRVLLVRYIGCYIIIKFRIIYGHTERQLQFYISNQYVHLNTYIRSILLCVKLTKPTEAEVK